MVTVVIRSIFSFFGFCTNKKINQTLLFS